MPKPLKKKAATSSVAAFLEPGVGAAALVKVKDQVELPIPLTQQREIIPEISSLPRGGAANLRRQFVLTPHADKALKQITALYSKATGIDLKSSEIIRAMLIAVYHAIPKLEREAEQIGTLKRTKNSKGNEDKRDALELKIAKAITDGMRVANELEISSEALKSSNE